MEIGNRIYQAYYKGRTIQLEAQSSYQAQVRAAQLLGVRRAWQVHVVLADEIMDTADLG
jgi:hypothetical protein